MGYDLFFRFTFSKNRSRLMQHDVAKPFFGLVVAQTQQPRMMMTEQFNVDGTLIDA